MARLNLIGRHPIWTKSENERRRAALFNPPGKTDNAIECKCFCVPRTGSLHIKVYNMCICLTSMTAGRPSLAPGHQSILLLKWLPSQRTIYSIVYKLDFQFIVIMATYICEAFWKERYIRCALIKWACMYVFARNFKHRILINQIQIQIRKSNEFDVIEWMRCASKLFHQFVAKILGYSTKNCYDYQTLFILFYCC